MNAHVSFIETVENHLASYLTEMESINLKKGLKILSDLCQSSNLFLQESFKAPCTLSDKKNAFALVFSVVCLLSDLYDPFIPGTCAKLRKMCCIEKTVYKTKFNLIKNHKISEEIEVLFG